MIKKVENFIIFDCSSDFNVFKLESAFNLKNLSLIFNNWNLNFFKIKRLGNNLKFLNLYSNSFISYFFNLKQLFYFFKINLNLFNSNLKLLNIYYNGFFFNLNYFFNLKFNLFSNLFIIYFFKLILNIIYKLLYLYIYKLLYILRISIFSSEKKLKRNIVFSSNINVTQRRKYCVVSKKKNNNLQFLFIFIFLVLLFLFFFLYFFNYDSNIILYLNDIEKKDIINNDVIENIVEDVVEDSKVNNIVEQKVAENNSIYEYKYYILGAVTVLTAITLIYFFKEDITNGLNNFFYNNSDITEDSIDVIEDSIDELEKIEGLDTFLDIELSSDSELDAYIDNIGIDPYSVHAKGFFYAVEGLTGDDFVIAGNTYLSTLPADSVFLEEMEGLNVNEWEDSLYIIERFAFPVLGNERLDMEILNQKAGLLLEDLNNNDDLDKLVDDICDDIDDYLDNNSN